METNKINPYASSRNRRIAFHKANVERYRAMKAQKHAEYYNYNGTRSVTLLLAMAAFTFAMFMYSVVVS
jgi:hypothetical protein